MSDNKVAIMGYSGHAFVVLDACKSMGKKVHYYCDNEERFDNPFHLKYLGDESNIGFDWNEVNDFILGIGDNGNRKKVYQLLEKRDKRILNIIHSNSSISEFSKIEKGTFVSSGVIINALTHIGFNCIINTGAIIEHECIIGNHTHIAPGAVLLGNVKVGNNCFIGSNVVVKENTTIEDNVIIGAGSVVLKNVLKNCTLVGNPAKKISL